MKFNQINTLVANLNSVIGSQESKTQKKLFRIYEKIKSHHESFQSEIEGLRLDNAQVDEKDCLILDEKGGYKFSKEGLKKLTKDITELGEKEFDFTPISIVNPQGLEKFYFLKDWVTGVNFLKEEEEEEL
jgi:hypothetical protein